MKIRFPLYGKIVAWFFLNLLLLAAVFYGLFKVQFRSGFDSLLLSQSRERVQALSELISTELSATPPAQWNEVLKRFSDAYQASLQVFRDDGMLVAGETVTLPKEVWDKLTGRGGQAEMRRRGPPPGRGPTRNAAAGRGAADSRFVLHTDDPNRYWMGAPLRLEERAPRRGGSFTLLIMSPDLTASGLFIDLRPWMAAGFGALLLSALFWVPLVRGITRSIGQMTLAAEQIAQGRFEEFVQAGRKDELGRLGQAINRMSTRLAGFVAGQKRFLGDVAHELCSPLARMQMALGILEQRADPAQKQYVEDLREEVQEMARLADDLLSFSKAGLAPAEIKLRLVNVAEIARETVAREAREPGQATLEVEDELYAVAEPELLARALANLVRNALRYGGAAGPVNLRARQAGKFVAITVADPGPGVPEESLQKIFDPFFRLEASRSRETGGMGLGLAIVKTCVEACQGSVSARNQEPTGLVVEITLPSSPKV